MGYGHPPELGEFLSTKSSLNTDWSIVTGNGITSYEAAGLSCYPCEPGPGRLQADDVIGDLAQAPPDILNDLIGKVMEEKVHEYEVKCAFWNSGGVLNPVAQVILDQVERTSPAGTKMMKRWQKSRGLIQQVPLAPRLPFQARTRKDVPGQ